MVLRKVDLQTTHWMSHACWFCVGEECQSIRVRCLSYDATGVDLTYGLELRLGSLAVLLGALALLLCLGSLVVIGFVSNLESTAKRLVGTTHVTHVAVIEISVGSEWGER